MLVILNLVLSTQDSQQVSNPLSPALNDFFNTRVQPCVMQLKNELISEMIDRSNDVLRDAHTKYTDLKAELGLIRGLIESRNSTSQRSEPTEIRTNLPGDISNLLELFVETPACNQCCGCRKQQKCLFGLYSKLKKIIDRHPDFDPIKSLQGKGNPEFMKVMPLIIGDAGKRRCLKCLACMCIAQDNRLRMLFELQQLENSGMASALLTNAFGSSDQAGNNMLPLLLTLMSNKRSDSTTSGCVNFGVDPTACPQSQQPCPMSVEQCPMATQPCPMTFEQRPIATQPCPMTTLPAANTQNQVPVQPVSAAAPKPSIFPPAYGIGANVQPIPNPPQAPVFAVSSASAAPPASEPAYGTRYGKGYN